MMGMLYTAFCVLWCSVIVTSTYDETLDTVIYEATDGRFIVTLSELQCPHAGEVMRMLAYKANKGILDWTKMLDEKYANDTMKNLCEKMRRENDAKM